MKYHRGFVSNSSSASFMAHWRKRTFGKTVSIAQAVGDMFGVNFKEGTDEIDWENSWNKNDREKVESIIEKTIANADGTFTSTFWTSMMNSTDDFGDAAKSLVMGLVAGRDFELIDSKVDSDEGVW